MWTLVIFSVMIGLIFLGIPVAVSMGLTAVLTFVAMGQSDILTMAAQRMYASTTSFTLLAIPWPYTRYPLPPEYLSRDH